MASASEGDPSGAPASRRVTAALLVRLPGSGAEFRVTLVGVMTQTSPPGTLAAPRISKLSGRTLIQPQTYEITFTGQAGTTLRAEFDDCEVTIGPGTTTLHAELPDQSALSGLMQRITGLGLEVIDVHRVAVPPKQ